MTDDDGDDPAPPFETTPTRRTVLGLAGAGVVGAVGLGELSARTPLRLDASVPDDEWHVPGRTPARVGVVPGEGPRGDIETMWSRHVGELRYYRTSPVVAGETVVCGAIDGLRAFAVGTGRERWHRSSTGYPADRGQMIVVNETVVANEGGAVVGLELTTGARRWRYEGLFSERLCRVGNAVAVVADREELVLLDARTGRPFWRMSLGSSLPDPLCVLDGRLFCADDAVRGDHPGRVLAIDPVDGSVLFDRTAPISNFAVPLTVSAADGRAFVGMQPSEEWRRLLAVDLADGSVTWSADFAAPEERGYITGGPATAVADGVVYGVDGWGDRVLAHDASTGAELWTAESADPTTDQPVVAGDRLLTRTEDSIVVWDRASGERLEVFDRPRGYGGVAVAGDVLFERRDETLTALSW